MLATMADAWAANCAWRHGQPETGTGQPAPVLGQNLYMVSGGAMNLSAGIQLWYDEKKDYIYETSRCAVGKVCGHYTQVKVESMKY